MSKMSDLDIERRETGIDPLAGPDPAEPALPPENDPDRQTDRIYGMSAENIFQQTFTPPREYVKGFLCEGLTILAGAPKCGKSWMALLLGCAVAEGKSFLGRETNQAGVLYLAYEDTPSRLKSRISTVSPIPPKGFYATTDPIHIEDGLINALTDWKRQYPDTGLVIVDTLGKVRRTASQSNQFASDYQEIASLKALADEYHMAVLLIHHLRKKGKNDNGDEDPFEMISGTIGLTAAADGMAILSRERGKPTARLVWTGRDTEDGEMILKFSEGIWQTVDRDAALRMEHENRPIVRAVRAYVNEPGFLRTRRISYEGLRDYGLLMKVDIGLTSHAVHKALKEAQEGLFRYDGIEIALGRQVNGKRGLEMVKVGEER